MKISLEEKLLQYKKNAKITNDAELKKALEDIIAQEELLPPDEIDHDLIFEAIGALFRLTGTTDDEIDEYADEAVQIHLEKLAEIDPRFASTDEDTEPRSKIRRINLKWLIPAAVLIALLAATLTTNAIIDLFGFSSKEYDELPNGVIYDDGSVEVEKTDDFQEFESLQSFIDSPYHEGLLIPYGYEDPFFCVVTNFGDHSETLMILGNL